MNFRVKVANDEQSFANAIQQDPRDRQLILVYADWLEEKGDYRAKVVRLLARYFKAYGREQKQIIDEIAGIYEGSSVKDLSLAVYNSLPVLKSFFISSPSLMNRLQYYHEPLSDESLEAVLPHGSGIDGDWGFEQFPNRVIAYNSYHVMNDMGMYVGWADFQVIIPRENPLAFRLQFRGQQAQRYNQRYMLRDYLEESIHYGLEQIIREENV